MRILKMGQLLEVDIDQLRAITEADPLTSTWEVAKELNVNHSMVIQHLNQIRKVRKLAKWAPHELTENQKKSSPWRVIFSYSTHNKKSFLDQIVMCSEKWIL